MLSSSKIISYSAADDQIVASSSKCGVYLFNRSIKLTLATSHQANQKQIYTCNDKNSCNNYFPRCVHCTTTIILIIYIMPGIASATGLLDARIRPVRRLKPKRVELSGSVKPVPFILRPFSGLFNPYPYGCSVLCNHPADCEAKDVLRRAKDSWATEGKALLLPEEMDMIRANLLAASSTNIGGNAKKEVVNVDEASVPEELFRKYTETDSRPLTPAPTLASGPTLTNRPNQEEFLVTSNPVERTTLVLDLRTNSKKQENETFTWHALTLELPPTSKKTEVSISKPVSRYHSRASNSSADLSNLMPTGDTYGSSSSIIIEEHQTEKISKEQPTIIRRRGKRLRKGKYRRGSTYGQQTEVRDLLEPTDTQISHIGDGSRRTSVHTANSDTENLSTTLKKPCTITNTSMMLPSFLEPDILKHLCRDLDCDKVEAEFSIRRKIAYEEALRVKGDSYYRSRRYQTHSNPVLAHTPRVFSRQVSRFEILHSESLCGLTVMEYLGRHVFVSSGRKLIYGRIFNKFQDDTIRDVKKILPRNIPEALDEVIGKPMTDEQKTCFNSLIGEVKEPCNFRSWCGLCAAVERLFCPLPQKEIDPPNWLEKVDFETLERRLKSVDVDPKLASLLRKIREK